MFYAHGGRRSGILWMGIVLLMFFSIYIMAIARVGGANGYPTLAGGKVTPENGAWGSTFTFEVVYRDPNNIKPAENYPKIYIDGEVQGRIMAEKDPTDNDVTDNKTYKYDWATEKENVGPHSFYFYVETSTGENTRDPSTGAYDGPLVGKHSDVFLICEVDNPEPVAGETITFSGRMETTEENLAGENIILYELLLDGGDNVGSTTTDENGYFTLTLSAPGQGIFCYGARFPGDDYYEASQSSILYVNTLDKPLVFGVYAVIILALVGVLIVLSSWGVPRAHYLRPVLFGFAVGFFLLLIGAGFIGVLAAGAIVGYMSVRENPRWTKYLRISFMASFLLLLAVELIITYFLIWFPGAVGLSYSVIQADVYGVLFTETISSLVYYTLWVAIGAMLGAMLRKPLKPAEQKPTTVAGPATTAASG